MSSLASVLSKIQAEKGSVPRPMSPHFGKVEENNESYYHLIASPNPKDTSEIESR